MYVVTLAVRVMQLQPWEQSVIARWIDVCRMTDMVLWSSISEWMCAPVGRGERGVVRERDKEQLTGLLTVGGQLSLSRVRQ